MNVHTNRQTERLITIISCEQCWCEIVHIIRLKILYTHEIKVSPFCTYLPLNKLHKPNCWPEYYLSHIPVSVSSSNTTGSSSIRAAGLQSTNPLPPFHKFREKLNILIKVLVGKYVHSLKAYEWNNFKSEYSRRTVSAVEIRAGCVPPSRCALA